MKTEPFEIVILNDYASRTGGSSSVAIASAVGLAERGVEVTFFSCVGPVSEQLKNKRNLRVICLELPDIGQNPNRMRAIFNGMRNSRAIGALREILARKSRDRTIVHAHTWSQALSPFILAAVTDLGFRLVITLHDFYLACPNGQFFVYPRQEICHRKPLSVACWSCNCDRRNYGHKLWRNTRELIQREILEVPQKAAHFVGVSDFSLKMMKEFLPETVPAKVIRNPVDCPASAPARVGENRAFLFIGRFEAEKGVLLFARAVKAAGVAATFIGDGSLMSTVRAICPQGRFTGWLSPEKIHAELKQARALVFPSLWYETLGIVVVEAAAAGVPAIIPDHSAAADFVRHEISGLHIAGGSAESLAEQMMKLSTDDALAARLGQAGYDLYWRDPWTTERHVTELVDIYNNISRPVLNSNFKEAYCESAGDIRARC